VSAASANLGNMWQSRTGASAMAVELAAMLILATAVSDALGLASVSFYLLVLGVPVIAAAGLICFARVVDAVNGGRMDALGRLQATLSALLVAAIVIGAAVREPFVAAGTIPPEASEVLAFCFALLVLQALIALVPTRRPDREERKPARPHSSLSR
jgi:hypothetical protein